ncbi:MAG TPA: MucR family transcriptional regulator [Kiloniellales bacterium]
MTDAGPEQSTSADLLRMTAEVVAAYVRNNPLPAAELSSIILTVHGSLAALDGGSASTAEPQRPAVSIRRSVQPDHIVCLEDGKKLKMLKRHLRTTYGMSPEEYRAKWGLPADYPMVAPNYAKQRSEFAKEIGLGRTSGRRKRR